jgi:hypothetical protein
MCVDARNARWLRVCEEKSNSCEERKWNGSLSPKAAADGPLL